LFVWVNSFKRVTGGELFDKIVERGTYSEKDAAKLVSEILDAISYLHNSGVVHRDLKVKKLQFNMSSQKICCMRTILLTLISS
jgi:serine/threonine protein kinase